MATSPEPDVLLYEKHGPVAHIVLNRPRQLNAYNVAMRDNLYELLGAVALDPEVRALVVRGAGDRAFCAGADLTEFGTAPSQAIARRVRFERDVWNRSLGLEKPSIAALHGFVLGSGLEIALCCDIRIASEDAQLGLPELGLGMIPAAGATQTLSRLVGVSRSLDMLLAGERVSARQALRWGLVNRVVAKERLVDEAQSLAEQIARSPGWLLSLIKRAVTQGAELPLAEALALEMRLASRALAENPGLATIS